MTINHHHQHHHDKQKQQCHHDHPERCLKASSNRGEWVNGEEAGGGEGKEGAGPEHVDFVTGMAMIIHVSNDNHHHHWHDDHDHPDCHLGGSGEGRACTVTSPTSSRPRQT